MTLSEMKARLQALLSNVATLQASEKPEDVETLVNVLDEAEKLQATIATKERAEKLQAHAAAPAPVPVKRVAPAAVATPKLQNKLDAFIAALPGGAHALKNAADDVFQEGQLADGGYLLPVDRRELVKLLAPVEMVHGLCDIIYTTSNATSVPVDEDPVWSSDLAAADVNEGAAPTEDKVAFGLRDLSLAKSMVYVRVTQEMLEDNTGIGAYVTGKLAEKLAWRLHAKAVAAFIASDAKVEVAKTTNAAAGSAPDLANIQAIWGSMLAPMRSKAVWLANPKLEAALQNLVIGTVPVYLPPTGIEGQPFGRLFGRPVMFIEGLPAVGTTGDIMLVDPSSFWLALKTQGARVEASAHAEFKNDIIAYKGAVRSGFKSKFSAPITRADATTAGNVVLLATRA
jgi:HK97 family phage major capsid protein